MSLSVGLARDHSCPGSVGFLRRDEKERGEGGERKEGEGEERRREGEKIVVEEGERKWCGEKRGIP